MSEKSFGTIIQNYRNAGRLSQSRLAEILSVSRNTVANWECNKCQPDLGNIRRLCLLLDIPLYELFDMELQDSLSREERLLLKNYRQLESVHQRTVSLLLNTMVQEQKAQRTAQLKDSFLLLPLQSTAAAAGSGNPFTDLPPQPIYIRKNPISSQADALVRVSGPSMEPLYHHDDLVYIKFSSEAVSGSDVVCSTADGLVIKRVKGNRLFSLNADYPFGEHHEDDHVIVLGRVLGVVSQNETADAEETALLEEMSRA